MALLSPPTPSISVLTLSRTPLNQQFRQHHMHTNALLRRCRPAITVCTQTAYRPPSIYEIFEARTQYIRGDSRLICDSRTNRPILIKPPDRWSRTAFRCRQTRRMLVVIVTTDYLLNSSSLMSKTVTNC